ncbi:MAG: hypothetical protein HON70_11140 [Lentisphaerae bacterium]|nr:hypothetical protein [Lentisphaerota bacterium]
MLNEHTNLIADGARHSLLAWTVEDPALENWVFVNGVKLYGPLLLDTLERSVPVPLRADECLAVEVHDVSPEGIATPVFETLTTTPEIQWNPLPGAQRYRLYHREGSGAERRVFDRPATDYRGTPIRIDAPVELNGVGGVWHFLRVEAVDDYGNESTRRAWRFFAQEPPRLPSRIEIADGASPGLFTITVTQ